MTFPPMSQSQQFKALARSKEQMPPGSEYYTRTRIRTTLERPVHPDVARGLEESLGPLAYKTLRENIGLRVVGEEDGGVPGRVTPSVAGGTSVDDDSRSKKGGGSLFEEVFGAKEAEYPNRSARVGGEGTLGAWLDRYGRPGRDLRVTAGFSKCRTHSSKFDRFRTIKAAHEAKHPEKKQDATAESIGNEDLPPPNY